jgi:hypothetical protein
LAVGTRLSRARVLAGGRVSVGNGLRYGTEPAGTTHSVG